jgi:hypothetical protein
MRPLVVSNCRLRLGLEDAVDSKDRQGEARINERLLNLLDRRTSAPKLQEPLVVETGLEHGIAGETRRTEVVAIAKRALEARCGEGAVTTLLDERDPVTGQKLTTREGFGEQAIGCVLGLVIGGPDRWARLSRA